MEKYKNFFIGLMVFLASHAVCFATDVNIENTDGKSTSSSGVTRTDRLNSNSINKTNSAKTSENNTTRETKFSSENISVSDDTIVRVPLSGVNDKHTGTIGDSNQNGQANGNKNVKSTNINKDALIYESTVVGDVQNIVISGKYNLNNSKTDTHAIKLKNGVKSISIDFRPEIEVDCGNKTDTKTKYPIGNCCRSSVDAPCKSKKDVKRKVFNKKITKNSKKNNGNSMKFRGAKSSRPVALKTQSSSLKGELTIGDAVADVKDKSKKVNTMSEADESISEISVNSKKVTADIKASSNTRENNKNGGTKVIERQIVSAPIYVINRIIGVDEDVVLTQDTVDKIAIDGNSSVTVYDTQEKKKNDSFKNAFLGDSETAFVNQYDVIENDDLKYGEVAFVSDYND